MNYGKKYWGTPPAIFGLDENDNHKSIIISLMIPIRFYQLGGSVLENEYVSRVDLDPERQKNCIQRDQILVCYKDKVG